MEIQFEFLAQLPNTPEISGVFGSVAPLKGLIRPFEGPHTALYRALYGPLKGLISLFKGPYKTLQKAS